VAGPAAAVQQVDQTLERLRPGAFAVRGYTDLDALTRAAAEREVYGGFVVGPQPVTVVASGGGSTVVALLTEIGEGLAAQSGTSAEIVDVAPPAADDPRGTGFGSIVLPVFMAGAILGIAVTQLAGRARIIAMALPAAAAVIGAVAVGAAMLVGVAAGGFWSQWLAMTAGIWAVSAAMAGAAGSLDGQAPEAHCGGPRPAGAPVRRRAGRGLRATPARRLSRRRSAPAAAGRSRRRGRWCSAQCTTAT